MREHAKLSASSAHRWLNCTPSAVLESGFPDSLPESAAEGTLAHAIAEYKLTKHFIGRKGGAKAHKEQMAKFEADPLYFKDMDVHTDDYLAYVAKVHGSLPQPPYMAIEKRVDFSGIVPDGFGTADCILIGGNTLHIIDLKYGKGTFVEVENNPQLMLYALGALNEYSMFYAIDTVVMHIFQPRMNNISSSEISANALREWGESIKPIAEMAYEGEGEQKTGDHCKFCKAAAVCRAKADEYMELAKLDFKKPPLLSNDEVGEILALAKDLVSWVNALDEYALSEALAGRKVKGWKVVEGRSNRAFTDIDAAFAKAQSLGYPEASLYERKPITLTAVEKLMGKKEFTDTLGEFVHKPQGKPTLVEESDKREEFNQAKEDFK